MKKIAVFLSILVLMASTAFAGSPGKSIGNTGDALITTGTGYLRGMIFNTDGTNSVTVTIYDNTTAANPKVISTFTVTTGTTDLIRTLSFGDQDCGYYSGMYFDITTSGTVTYDVFFESE